MQGLFAQNNKQYKSTILEKPTEKCRRIVRVIIEKCQNQNFENSGKNLWKTNKDMAKGPEILGEVIENLLKRQKEAYEKNNGSEDDLQRSINYFDKLSLEQSMEISTINNCFYRKYPCRVEITINSTSIKEDPNFIVWDIIVYMKISKYR